MGGLLAADAIKIIKDGAKSVDRQTSNHERRYICSEEEEGNFRLSGLICYDSPVRASSSEFNVLPISISRVIGRMEAKALNR